MRKRARWHALKQLYVQVIIGILAGIALGVLAPSAAIADKPLGDAFIGLLRMMLAPIIFCSVVHGLGSRTSPTCVSSAAWRWRELCSTSRS